MFNPAAAGALLGALVFATAPAWWASVSQTQELLLVALGIIVVLRAPGTWRSIAVFFPLYVVIVSLLHASTGASVSARVLLLGAIDPSVAFFGFFMVAEPRTGPRDPDQRMIYAAVIAVGASILPQFMPNLRSWSLSSPRTWAWPSFPPLGPPTPRRGSRPPGSPQRNPLEPPPPGGRSLDGSGRSSS